MDILAIVNGFIKGRSTVLQLLKILDDWTNNLDQGKQIDVICTDFEKAFDKVPHHGLFCKLEEYHLDHRLLHWITDFLCNRKQRVRVNGCYSQWYRVESGIPQGSILGPILFLIYINDLLSVCRTQCPNTKIFLYADDAKVYNVVTSDEDQKNLQRVVDKVKEWCDQWLLSLNVTKCYHMSYSSRQSIDTSYYMQQKESACIFQKVDYIKDLGVFVDSQLTFSEHIHQKINKAYSMLGIIKRNFIHKDPRTFILLYKALVRPHVEYANSVWSPLQKR